MNNLKLFTCPVLQDTLKLTLSIQGCAKNHFLANKQAKNNQYRDFGIFEYCQLCKIGANNLKKLGKKLIVYEKQTKICDLYKVAPDRCHNEKYNGIFVRDINKTNAGWANKKYCCPECGNIYNHLVYKGLIK